MLGGKLKEAKSNVSFGAVDPNTIDFLINEYLRGFVSTFDLNDSLSYLILDAKKKKATSFCKYL